MKTRKWYDYKSAAESLEMSLPEFRAVMRNKDLEFRDHLSRAGTKRMISHDGLEAIRLNRKPKTRPVITYYKIKSLTEQQCKKKKQLSTAATRQKVENFVFNLNSNSTSFQSMRKKLLDSLGVKESLKK